MQAFKIVFAMALGVPLLCNAQVGCPSPGSCVNPVPVEVVGGTWNDNQTGQWTVTMSGSSISGSLTSPNPNSSLCPTVTWTVSGSITIPIQTDGTQGNTSFSWGASSPSPSSTCAGYTPVSTATFAGNVQNNGNDRLTGTITTPTNSVSATASKFPTDSVVSETTNFVGFGSGAYATVGQFRQLLSPGGISPPVSFTGRQVSETTGTGTAFDNCWFTGSAVSKFVVVAGSTWNVGYYSGLDSYWVDDYIGWSTVAVNYYRGRLMSSSFPCQAQIPQVMHIATGGTSGSTSVYQNDTLTSTIDLTTVTVSRNGVAALTSYP